MSELSSSQQAALEQVRQITDGQDPDRELAVLESVNWDVERALEALFSDETPQAGPSSSGPSSSRPPQRIEQMDIDDSEQAPFLPSGAGGSGGLGRPAPRNPANAYPILPRIGLNLASIVSFPLTLISNLIQLIFRILRVPFTFIPRIFGAGRAPARGPSSGGRNGLVEDPATVADRFVRELEDETGAVTVSHAASAASEVPSSSQGESEKSVTRVRLLPDFFIGSYEQVLKAAETDLKVLCVVLLSSEHDDNAQFRNVVLTDPDLVRLLTDNDFLVWGGDIRDREGFQASHKLSATTYPFVAFISLHPPPSRIAFGSNVPTSTTPRLTVLSRHEGSPAINTSAQTLRTHITSSLLPRVTPLLSRLRTERWNRAQERILREEQDRAFQETANRDRERILQRQEDERRAREERALRESEEQKALALQAKGAEWRRWARSHLVPAESTTGTRVGIRLPDGKRVIRKFDLESIDCFTLYAYVDTLFISPEDSEALDPPSPPAEYQHEWAFRLASSFPRKEIPSTKGTILATIDGLKGGANLVVEMTTSLEDDETESEED